MRVVYLSVFFSIGRSGSRGTCGVRALSRRIRNWLCRVNSHLF